jgi:transcriptional regulator NrdR family protein
MSVCTECGSWNSKVKESRKDTRYGWKWRLRDCVDCGHRWSTYEMPADNIEATSEGDPNGKLHR